MGAGNWIQLVVVARLLPLVGCYLVVRVIDKQADSIRAKPTNATPECSSLLKAPSTVSSLCSLACLCRVNT
jgi:hypothetical protein